MGLSLVLAPALAACGDSGGRTTADEGVNSLGEDQGDGDETSGDGDGDTSGDGDADTNTTDDDDTGPIPDPKFDVATMPDSPDICLVPQHNPCDHLDYPNEEAEAWRALGLNCPGEFQATLDYNGHYLSWFKRGSSAPTTRRPTRSARARRWSSSRPATPST